MKKARRVKRSAATWRELFTRQVASGLAVSEFCRREGINAGLFRRWRAGLGKAGQVGRARLRPARGEGASVPFIDLGALGAVASGWQVRLELGGGLVLSLVRG